MADNEEWQTVMAICNVSSERARELLEAATGSVERAVDIHFLQSSSTLRRPDVGENGSKRTGSKRPAPPGENSKSPPSSAKSKASVSPKKQSPQNPSKQRKLDSFFSPTNKATKSPVASGSKRKASLTSENSNIAKEESQPSARRQVSTSVNDNSTTGNEARNHKVGVEATAASGAEKEEVSIPYSVLAHTFAKMASTTKRNVKLQALKELFGQAIDLAGCVGAVQSTSSRNDEGSRLLTCVLELTLGQIESSSVPLGKNGDAEVVNRPLPLQLSGSSVSSAIQTITGASRSQIREAYRSSGDLGDTAAKFQVTKTVQSFFVNIKPAPALTVKRVHDTLTQIATVPQGKGSQACRQNLVMGLLRGCKDKEELRFLVRTLLGNMRLGATIKSVLAGLAMAVDEREAKHKYSSDENAADAVQRLQKIFHVCPRLHEICSALLTGGIDFAEETCTLSLGLPVEPMLANPAQSLEQVGKFLEGEQAIAEWKYDGVRCQAHWDGKATKIFSRHLLECTSQYPDAAQSLVDARKEIVNSFILDAEIVGVVPTDDNESGFRFLPFQDLSTRRSKAKGVPKAEQVQVRVYAFDLMFLNGESLLRSPYHVRQAKLRSHFIESEGFAFARAIDLPFYDESLVQSTLQKAMADGAEGLMIKLTGKKPASEGDKATSRTYGYEAGTRSQLWLKMKKDYMEGFCDTIDVVPIGAWFGNGRKAQKGFWSPILLAVYDEDDGTFHSVSRCMSFSDSMYSAIRDFYENGTPYPSGVGVDSEDQNKSSNDDGDKKGGSVEAGCVSDGEKDMSGDSGSDHDDQEGAADGSGTVDEGSRVNCFQCRPPSTVVVTNENASIWLKPMEVWEVAFADLTLSRTHTASSTILGDADERGIALRFPRFKRRRPDKSVEQATTTRQLAQLFAAQTKIAK